MGGGNEREDEWKVVGKKNLHKIYKYLQHLHSPKLTVRTCQEATPKGKDRLPTMHFQVRTLSFSEGKQSALHNSNWIGVDVGSRES